MADARKTFEEMPEKDSVSWNTVIVGYVRVGNVGTAVQMFTVMRWFEVDVNVAVVIILSIVFN
jgi:pentatricopeptide repeat protein